MVRCGRIRFIGVVGMWLNGDECHQGGWICQTEDGCGLMIMFVGKFISRFFLLRRVVEFGIVCLVQ